MTTQQLSEAKAAARAAWRLGDYHRFATELVWEVGPVLVEACGIVAGQRVLDVAAGTGNVAIRAAEAGASVVASDLTPEHFEAGRAEARRRGVELDWVEADAEALPFGDGEFDVVTSSFGAMFAPDHRAVADELVRVCRPGGTIGLASFTPDGLARRVLRPVRPVHAAAAGRRRAAGPLGERGSRPRPLRRPRRLAHAGAKALRRARREPRGLLRVLQGDVRPGRRGVREPRRRAGSRGRARPGVPRLRHRARTTARRRARPRTATSTCSRSPTCASERLYRRSKAPLTSRVRSPVASPDH